MQPAPRAPWEQLCPTPAPLGSSAHRTTAQSAATAMQGSTASLHLSRVLQLGSSMPSSTLSSAMSVLLGTTAPQEASTPCPVPRVDSSRVCAPWTAQRVGCAPVGFTAPAMPPPPPRFCAQTATSAPAAQALPLKTCAPVAISARQVLATQPLCHALRGSTRTSSARRRARRVLQARTAQPPPRSRWSASLDITAPQTRPQPQASPVPQAASATRCPSLPRQSASCALLGSSAPCPGRPLLQAPVQLGTTACAAPTKPIQRRARMQGTHAP